MQIKIKMLFAFTHHIKITRRIRADLMAQLAPLLRARKDLSETDVKYLQQVIGATIERARAQG